MSADPTFLASRPLYEGPRNWFEIWTGEELSYYRVAVAEGGRRSAWSNTEFDRSRPPISGSQHRGSIGTAVPANLPESAQALDAAGISTLLDVHTAILRVCLARGDLFAVLALPSGTRGDDAVAYRVRLATRLDADEERLAAFGALYHPWPVVHDAAGGPLRLVSPDGTAAGVIARRAATAGGWVSPANQAWQGVAALEPPLTRSEADRLRQARMNLIAQQPAGFTSLSAWTLHGDIEFEELNQRLLAFLLRRLAARDGMAFAFQPNGYALRRQIEREFDRVLGDLYTRGAFAGLTRAEAYRVLTDDSLNTEASIDAGRCLVELQYAPSRPMAFLTIRLVQTGGGTVVAEEGTGG